MPEYLAPGVYVEEVSFRSKSIEGVPTSTTGFVGMTRYGPVWYQDGPTDCEPRLITSFTEFEWVYGGLETLHVGDADPGEERLSYLAHAARSFFDNGGKRLYVSRVFAQRGGDNGIASRVIPVSDLTTTWKARWPGKMGNVRVETEVVRSRNLARVEGGAVIVPQARAGMVVEVIPNLDGAANLPDGNDPLDLEQLRVVQVDEEGAKSFLDKTGTSPQLEETDVVQLVELKVSVRVGNERKDEYNELSTSPLRKRDIRRILALTDPEDENAVVWLEWDPTAPTAAKSEFLPALLMEALQKNPDKRLEGGTDGALVTPDDLKGKSAHPDYADRKGTGLGAFEDIDDIAIVAAPDGGTFDAKDSCRMVASHVIQHAEDMRYRIGVIDAPRGSSLNQVREFRGQLDSKYAALYHPWIEILDPTERAAQGAPPKRLLLPPSGAVAGIYARTDITRGVHKAPANEVVQGLTRFEANINKGRQDVLNPEGINALRFFEGRGHRVWGARTISSDPEWKYVNVRRLFIYMEHSIDKGMQWAVFEPNGRRLWDNVRRTVEDFLLVLWRDGALLGDKPEQAFFVRCDRTTMTQNDLDNGRMICLIGVAPVKPAEFVIFRIGQWTADAKMA